MINFRFHVLAVGAVVTAVVAGLVLGTLALRGPVSAPARAATTVVDQRNADLQQQVDLLNERLSAGEKLATELAPSLLAGRLAGRRVTVVTTSSGGHDAPGVEAMLTAGGAIVAGRVELTDRFNDPTRRDDLLDLALASLPPGVAGGLPSTGDGVTASAALLGAVLLRRTPPVPDGDIRSVLSAYVSQGFLTGGSGVSGAADALVMLSGVDPADSATPVLAAGLGQAGPVVAAGAGAGGGTAIGRLRSDARTAALVSTVDNVNTPQGKLATAWAVADQLAGRVGHYGESEGATTPLPPLPPPTPTPSPSPTASPSP